MIRRYGLIAALLLAIDGPAYGIEPELVLDQLTATYPQPDRMATVTTRGTEMLLLPSASFNQRFDTLTIIGVWKNPTTLNFREARLQFHLLNKQQQIVHTVLAEHISVFHQNQSSKVYLMLKVTPPEEITAVKPSISYTLRTYQEEYQRYPRIRGL